MNDAQARTMRHGERPLIFALDYPGYRTEAKVEDLQLDQYGLRIRNLLRHPLPRVVDGAAYVSRILAGSSAGDGPVAAVAAYCTSAPFAFEVAAVVSRSQQRSPKIILFDAEASTPDMILESYRAALSGIGVQSTEQELRKSVDMALLAADPRRFVDLLIHNIEREVIAVLQADGSGEEEATESARHMANAYADWLSHLVSSYRSSVVSSDFEVLNIISADGPPKGFECAAGVVRDVRMTCDRARLLRSEETRSAVLSALAVV
ncbi:hypothetical protein NE236_24100 [Actinoallomurus purpureus]|uniref:hypothetical protein n=1 Tax=Actinoallomurus purpureus TaxID=478114 RepID=UPI002093A012|nr:hypothetical protein [Actinoallomurus purpureus]MCO6008066.1 hypothetical protein [Actinoallomurus purpureus]